MSAITLPFLPVPLSIRFKLRTSWLARFRRGKKENLLTKVDLALGLDKIQEKTEYHGKDDFSEIIVFYFKLIIIYIIRLNTETNENVLNLKSQARLMEIKGEIINLHFIVLLSFYTCF